ncbi:MAG: hypothetical protein IT443_13170 [Phycisphaeraceae bacterium]|nr:hypothetical protein [Phycisphaeraceae bacterium]
MTVNQPDPRLTLAPTDAAAPPLGEEQALDPAQQSLADAMRVMFVLLKLVMLGVIVAFMVSGCFTVKSQEVAVRLLFGQIVGDGPSQQVLRSRERPYFAAPYPIMQVIKIPTTSRRVDVNDAFWFQLPEQAAGVTAADLQRFAGPLNPEFMGSLLTGDANIVHARWSVTYFIEDPVTFIAHVADLSATERKRLENLADFASPQRLEAMADQMVRLAAEQAVVSTVAQLTADQIQKGLGAAEFEITRRHLQATLQDMDSGLKVENVSATNTMFPLATRDAFQEVLRAENEKARNIEDAQKERSSILGAAAGEAYEPLLRLMDAYQEASTRGDQQRVAELAAALDKAFTDLQVPRSAEPGAASLAIGGRVSEVINDANVYRTQVVKRTQSEADYFNRLRAQPMATRVITLDRLWQDAVQDALLRDVELLLVPPGWQPYLDINRDPQKWRQREEKRIKMLGLPQPARPQ